MAETWRELAERVAKVVGVTSAAGAALRELKRREDAGEHVEIWRVGRKWIVGPASEALTPSGGE